MTREELLELLENDRELIDQILQADEDLDREDARVARVLVRELEVNWPGVEIILRMRREILQMHQQTAELLQLLAARIRR